MNGLVWLASYPRSGNTWFRLLIEAAFGQPGALDINRLQLGHRIASSRRPIDDLSLIDTHLLTHREVDWLRPGIYEAYARGEAMEFSVGNDETQSGPFVVKVHDAYATDPAGAPLFAAAKAAILIVRDPRAVAPSLAKFFNKSVDQAIDDMASSDHALAKEISGDSGQVRQQLFDWGSHTVSWLDQTDVPVHVVRYEDLRAHTAKVFSAAMSASGLELDGGAVERAVAATEFRQLQAQERENGFVENVPHLKRRGPFFRQGEPEGWRAELTEAQIARIESDHEGVMRRLGYLLS